MQALGGGGLEEDRPHRVPGRPRLGVEGDEAGGAPLVADLVQEQSREAPLPRVGVV